MNEEKSKSFVRKAVSFVLITVTGGVALSALDDLAIYHGCSRYVPLHLELLFSFIKDFSFSKVENKIVAFG